MKYLIVSDIHGDVKATKIAIKKFSELKCDKMILLGDILSYDMEANIEIVNMLNFFKDDVIGIKGNGEAHYPNPFEFELRDHFLMTKNNQVFMFVHGHELESNIDLLLGVENPIIIYGHTHRVSSYISGGIKFINIGSISLPRGGSKKCYGIMNENVIKIYDLDDKEIL